MAGYAGIAPHLWQTLERLEKVLGHRFSDPRLAIQALTHPSALEDDDLFGSYERLEFLGDAYLGAIISELLYHEYPGFDEGGMTRVKIGLVSGQSLSAKASELGLADLIIFGSAEHGTGKRGLHSALENVFEALIAALALDAGFSVARDWVIATIGGDVSPELAQRSVNPKSRLQELMQERHVTPTYQLVSTEGPAHDRRFTARVMAGDQELAEGSGRSIKDAEVAAAALAIERLDMRIGQVGDGC